MSTFREQMKGFPTWQIFVISIMRFLEPLAFTSLFPYVYFMIRDFHIAEDETGISKYAGYLSASFAFSQFLFGIKWGSISDRIGRKRVLVIGLFGTSVALLTFGFSPNYYIALMARLAMGAVNGNIAVLRTMIGEMVTERSHQAIAFSTLPLLWNVGSVIGPLIGGSKYLTRPHKASIDTVDDFYDDFLNKYPYALSNIVVSLIIWFGILCGVLFLEETHYKAKMKRDIGLEIGDWILNRLGFETPVRPWQKFKRNKKPDSRQLLSEASPLLTDLDDYDSEEDIDPSPPTGLYADTSETGSIASAESGQSVGPMSGRMSDAIIRRYSSVSSMGPNLSTTISRMSGVSMFTDVNDGDRNEDAPLKEIFTGPVIQTVTANFLTSFHCVIYNEFLPVFLAGKLMVDELNFPFKIKGGFGFESDTIGSLISITGMFGVMVIVLIFPYLDRNFKSINNFRVSQFLFPIAYCILPMLIFTLHEYNSKFAPGLTKRLLYCNAGVYLLASSTAFPQVVLLVHRAAPPKHRAFVNGACLSLNSLARFIGPTIWGILMSYFDEKSLGGFTWFILAGISFGSLIQSFTMKEYDEDAKE